MEGRLRRRGYRSTRTKGPNRQRSGVWPTDRTTENSREDVQGVKLRKEGDVPSNVRSSAHSIGPSSGEHVAVGEVVEIREGVVL